jgi:WD40 repeat protein
MRRLALLLLLLSLGTFACSGNAGPPPGPPEARADKPPADKPPDKKAPADKAEPANPEQAPERVSLGFEIGGHTKMVRAAVFTPDGKELMTASLDNTARFWDLESGETTQVLRPPLRQIICADLSPDGKLVALGGGAIPEDKSQGPQPAVILMNRKGEFVRRLTEKGNQPWTLAFSPDGKWLASSTPRAGVKNDGPGNDLRLWDVEKGERIFTWADKAARGLALAFSPDGKQIVTATASGDCAVWEPGSKEPKFHIPGHTQAVAGVAWSPDGKYIATAGEDGLRLYDLKEKKSTLLTKQFTDRVTFSKDGKKLLYCARAFDGLYLGQARDLATGQEGVFPGHKDKLTACALSADGRLAATAGGSAQEIFLWKTTAPMVDYRRFGGAGGIKYAVGVAKGGKSIAWGTKPVDPEENFQAQAPLGWSFSFETLSLRKLTPETLKAGEYQRAELSRDGLTVERHADHHGIDVKEGTKTISTWRTPDEVLCATLLSGRRVLVGVSAGFGHTILDADTGKNIGQCVHGGLPVAVACSPDGRWAVSAATNMALWLWDLEQPKVSNPRNPQVQWLKPTLALFAAGQDKWITWTPEGYYAASPNGEPLMGWEVENGPNKPKTFYSADQFRKSLYKPDVIKALLAQGDLEKALRWVSDKERKPLQAADVLPPTVAIVEPNDTVILEKPALTIKAVAEKAGQDDVQALQLLVDGRPFPTQPPTLSKDAKTGKMTATWKVRAPGDRHRFSVLAQTKTAEGRSAELWVNNVAPPPAPRLFFLGIGIDAYPGGLKLDCAVNDATALEQAILAQHKANPLFDEVLTRPLLDKKATRKEILEGLDWLKGAQPEDVVVIFYAGHGDRDGDGDFRLLAVDYNAARLNATTVSGKEFKEKLAALESRRVLLILDACHSGSIATDALAGDLKQPECGVTVLCAAQGDETSRESARDRHGYFTKWLLDGLKGAAGTNKAGEITLARLYVHVEEKVPAETDDQQHPVLVGLTAIRSFALAKGGKPAKP